MTWKLSNGKSMSGCRAGAASAGPVAGRIPGGLAVLCALAVVCAGLAMTPQGYAQAGVVRTVTRTALHADTATVAGRMVVKLSVHVEDATGKPVNAGTVSFVSGKDRVGLGSAVVKKGEATLNVDGFPAGSQQVTAVYDGNDAFGQSISAAAKVEANDAVLPDFTLTAAPTSLTVVNGTYGNVVVTATPQGGFNLPVSLSCSGLLVPTTCTFNPTLLITTKGASSSTLQIQTELSSPAMVKPLEPFGGRHMAYALLAPGVLALLGLAGLRKRAFGGLRMLGILALLGACTLGMSACAPLYQYNHHPPTKNPGTIPGVYTVTIAGFANNGGSVTSHTLQVVLTVK